MTASAAQAAAVRIWGSELSPFTLKLRALCEAAGVPYTMLPDEGTRLQNYRAIAAIELGKRRRTIRRYPTGSDLDEYPLVPLLFADGMLLYDSSALAHWLDARHPAPTGPLVPDDPALAFAAQLIDEAFDEFGLYLVHHARWVVSAKTNDAGTRLGREFRRVLPPGGGSRLARRFAARQVRRLPYLFSVAGDGDAFADLPPALQPPARPGFPPTHRLLNHAWESYVDGVEAVMREQPFLLGERFTLADASVYGELGMNLKDPTAAERLRERAPLTYAWLVSIRDRGHVGRGGPLRISTALRGLFDAIDRTFVPLMQQNEAAYLAARAAGETLFNEAAFNRRRALYEGRLLGQPYRAVVKTFQVRVWRELRAAWAALPMEARAPLLQILPPGSPFS